MYNLMHEIEHNKAGYKSTVDIGGPRSVLRAWVHSRVQAAHAPEEIKSARFHGEKSKSLSV